MMKILIVFVGGGIGATLRYLLSGLVHTFTGSFFPWGTLTVNLVGCLFIGALWSVFEQISVSPQLRTFLLIGILGAFTTFSTFTIESLSLVRDGEFKLAVLNVVLSNVLGFILAFAGVVAVRYVFK